MAATVLRKIQFGAEGTAGTVTAATTVMAWPHGATLNDERELVLYDQAVGQAMPVAGSYQPQLMATVEVPDTPATFEQLPYWFEGGIRKCVTVVADTGGSGHKYIYTYANTTAPTIRTYTIEGQTGQQEREMYHSFVEEFTISGAANEAIMVSGRWRGRTSTDGTMTASKVVPTINERLLFNKTTAYITTTTVAFGATACTATVLGFTINIPTAQRAVTTADGTNQFTTVAWAPDTAPDGQITGELVVRHNSNGEVLYDAAVAGTVKLLRLQCNGSTLDTAGSAFTTKALRIDGAIEFTEVPNLDEMEGEDTYTLPFRFVDAGTAAKDAPVFTIVNQLAALV